jgi:lipoprotein-anchoring transpeptidase ErfK/SrfK
VKTSVRWLHTLLGSSFQALMGLLAVVCAVLTMSTPAQAQSVSDLLNNLFGASPAEKRSAPPQRAKPRPEPRAERAEPRSEPQRRAEPARLDRPEKVEPAVIGLPVTPGEPQLAVVTLGTQSLRFYSGGKLVESAPISSGGKDTRTPTGVFTVIERHRDHESNLYESAPMPFMHRLTWSGIALHQGVLPGHPASHGCIRLPKAFVERLWEVSKVGMRVVVSPSPVQVEAVSSPLLFTPKFTPVPDDIVAYLTPERAASTGSPTTMSPTTMAEAKTTSAGGGEVKNDAGPTGMLAASPVASKPKLKLNNQQIAALKAAAAGATSLNPMQAGVVERIRAQALAPITQKAADEALAAAAAASAKANDASSELRAAEAGLRAAKARVGDVTSEPAMATTPAMMVPAVSGVWSVVAASAVSPTAATDAAPAASPEAKARLDAQRLVLKAKARLDAAIADDGVKSPAAFAAAAAARQAVVTAEEAEIASKVSTKRSSPISVLISAKDQRLYVRQGLNPVFDAPVIVRAGPEPIGTHVFQAVSATNEALNWVTVSVGTETLSDDDRYLRFTKAMRTEAAKNRAAGLPEAVDPIDPATGSVAALRALERFDLGPELTEKLAELAWVGAWIIVSEQPLSKETGPIGTDHVILTK